MILVIQYLEPSPETKAITPQAARERLRQAFERLLFDAVLLGWDLPPQLEQAVAEETQHWNAALYHWHPVLSGDSNHMPPPGWQTIGADGQRVAGFMGMPEFTFICPNHPAVQESVTAYLMETLQSDLYQGFFLDRIRFPSPASDPTRRLACFCTHCQHQAAEEGLDLEEIRRTLQQKSHTARGKQELLHAMLSPHPSLTSTIQERAGEESLIAYLRFRQRSITRLVQGVAREVHARGLAVGLDCFSPALTRSVGQELNALQSCADWVKIMNYGHAFGPATLPFELLALGKWLVGVGGMNEAQALSWLGGATGLELPDSFQEMQASGLPSAALAAEVQKARNMGVRNLLAGVELVEIPGICSLKPSQMRADLQALKQSGVDGLALSWDLWRIPLERLDLVGEILREFET